MKHLSFLPLVFIAFGSYSQAIVQFKNTSPTPVIVNLLALDVKDTISGNGVGKLLRLPVIRTNDEVILYSKGNAVHINSNRSAKDTAYTDGVFSFQLFYNTAKNKWYSRLKKL